MEPIVTTLKGVDRWNNRDKSLDIDLPSRFDHHFEGDRKCYGQNGFVDVGITLTRIGSWRSGLDQW